MYRNPILTTQSNYIKKNFTPLTISDIKSIKDIRGRNMHRFRLLLASFLLTLPILGAELGKPTSPKAKSFDLVTMARSGNTLLFNTIFKIAKLHSSDVYFGTFHGKSKCSVDPQWYLHCHFYDRKIHINSKRPCMALIRDPRDLAVATVLWHDRMIKEDHWLWTCEAAETTEIWKKLTFDKKLAAVIGNRFDTPPYNHFKQDCELAALWMQKEGLFIVRFEDLVGSKKGGSQAARAEAIAGIADFLELELPGYALENLTNGQYLKHLERQDGDVGLWKKRFSRTHKKLFKKLYGDQLIVLGYEKNYHW